MFAVIKTGGKQYRVAADQVIKVDSVPGEPGDIVEFSDVLVLGGDSPVLGTPTVAGAMVAGELLDQGRGRKVIAFKKRRRKNSRRKRGHRQEFSLVRITEILTDGQKPSKTVAPRRKAKAQPAPAESAAPDEVSAASTAAEKPKAARKTASKPAAAKAKSVGKAKDTK